MATAFVSLSRLAAAFRRLLATLAPHTAPSAAAPARAVPATALPGQALKPLRVVRVLEPSAPRSTAGRMVISGRLADVCAELDRLAALEAQGC
ncbi:hypothetical protein [Ramlibacter alkalitolerans]|uniref:Uncharacterized protein n=1 Tax=Ramlibacter alkalitolerans TaxID=2039631 RepID=A0ABS1JKM4_9BURK|nr:hypothetical protein [Ramlibacter alkalitolerans]MBL0424784.1 hypothetical protein [Ramlibacter alkalitolerans]